MEKIMANVFQNLMYLKTLNTYPKNSTNLQWDKYKEIHTQTHHSRHLKEKNLQEKNDLYAGE